MLNYGIIEEHQGQLKVRVLVHNGAKGQAGSTPTKDLPNAVVDSREKNGYKDGDTVVVGYIYGDTAHPVVLFPYGARKATASERELSMVEVVNTAKLPKNTNIGDITGDELYSLKGIKYPLIEKLKRMEESSASKKELKRVKETIPDITDVEAMKEALAKVYRYKGTKDKYSDLPNEGMQNGDVYNVETAYGNYPAGTNWAWVAESEQWDALGGSIDLSGYAQLDNLLDYVTLATEQSIEKLKTFEEGIKVQSVKIEYNETTETLDFIF